MPCLQEEARLCPPLEPCSVAQSCLTLCDPMDCSMPGFPVLHHLPEFAQTHVRGVGDDIPPFCSLSNLNVNQPFSSVALLCPNLCDPMNHSVPGLPVHHQLPESIQTHVQRFSDTIQPSHPLSSPSPPALNLSQHQGLFQWVSSSHQVATGSQSIGASASTGF